MMCTGSPKRNGPAPAAASAARCNAAVGLNVSLLNIVKNLIYIHVYEQRTSAIASSRIPVLHAVNSGLGTFRVRQAVCGKAKQCSASSVRQNMP
jgi:hypothetical protein